MTQRQLEVLKQVATGKHYQEVIAAYPGMTFFDLFAPREEVVMNQKRARRWYVERRAAVRRVHSRAYDPWFANEEILLLQMANAAYSIAEMSAALQRPPGAIAGRLATLDWMPPEGSRP